MDLDERKRRILAVIAEVYTATGEPVGSKFIAGRLNEAYSPATIRNDMAALFELGLLEQPHTSAGRVLSHMGYRVYLEDLMPPRAVDTRRMDEIRAMFNVLNPDPDKLLEDVVEALSEVTGCAVFTATITPRSVTVKRVVLIPASENTVVIMIMASNGVIRSKVCRVSFRLQKEIIDFFTAFAESRIIGLSLEEVSQSYLGTVAISLGEYSRIFTPILAAIYELCSEIYEGQYHITGATKLLSYPEFAERAYELLNFLSHREKVVRLLDNCGENRTTVTIGKENPQMELAGSSVVLTKYNIGRHTTGAIGIIGPIRMDYAGNIAEMEYFADQIGELLSGTFEDS